MYIYMVLTACALHLARKITVRLSSISCGRYSTAAKAFEFGVRYQSTMAWVTCKIYAYVYLYIYI